MIRVENKRLTNKYNRMRRITEIDGILYFGEVPCSRDENYQYSLAEYLGLTFWLCPFCNAHLIEKDKEITCINKCHLENNSGNK